LAKKIVEKKGEDKVMAGKESDETTGHADEKAENEGDKKHDEEKADADDSADSDSGSGEEEQKKHSLRLQRKYANPTHLLAENRPVSSGSPLAAIAGVLGLIAAFGVAGARRRAHAAFDRLETQGAGEDVLMPLSHCHEDAVE